MIPDTFTIISQLLETLRNPSLSFGDFQKNAELIKRGLDFMVADKKTEAVQN